METDRLRIRVTARVGRMLIDAELDTGPGTLVLVGPNGAGKSSLLALALGVLPVEQGRISVGDSVLCDTARNINVPLEQRCVGYVPQDYALLPHLNVRENLEFALASASPRQSRSDRTLRIDSLLEELGLAALREQRTQTLSGGERQRVALARALCVAPRALLLDEPLAALDVHSRRKVRAFLASYLAQLTLPTIVVSHDAADARRLGQRIAVLEGGKITQTGTWDELSARPCSRFVEELIRPERPGLE